MTDDDAEIQSTSDRLLDEVRRLRAAEERKRQEPVSSPEFHRLAAEVEEQARAVWQTAGEQRQVGREPGDAGARPARGRRGESPSDISGFDNREEAADGNDRVSSDAPEPDRGGPASTDEDEAP